MPRFAFACVALFLQALCPAATFAAERYTTNTLKLKDGERSPPATIQDMAWYAGTWRGDGLGGFNEEIWSAPAQGAMIGMYRMLEEGRPVLYELLTLTEEGGSLMLRLKHFHPDLKGWEERDVSVQMPFVAKQDGRLYFDGMTFEPASEGSVTIYLAVENRRDGSVREEVFRYRRAP